MTGLGLTIFYIYAFLTKLVQSRWMDMGQVLFRVFKSIKMQEKKKQGQHSAILTEQAWSIKDLLYG